MQLTTLARVKAWVTLANASQHEPAVRSMIGSVSSRIEAYLRRHVQIALRTEDYYAEMLGKRFFLKAAPVFATTAVAQFPGGSTIIAAADPTITYDPLRDFDGAASAENAFNYYFRYEDGQFEFDFPMNYTGYRNPGAFRIAYYGGMAYTLDQLVANSLTHTGAALAVGDAVTGSNSGATGTILAYTPGATITVRVLSGIFEVGESFSKNSTDSAAFTSLTNAGVPLCIAYPELVDACNMQVAWWFQRREMQGITNFSNEGASITMEKSGTLLKGVQDTIDHLVRYGTTY